MVELIACRHRQCIEKEIEMELQNKSKYLFTWCFWTIFIALYAVALFTPIIDFQNLILLHNGLLVIQFAWKEKRIKDITSLEIVGVCLFFFYLGIYL